MTDQTFLKNLQRVYRHEICVPYTLSFPLTLVIYWMEYVFKHSAGWGSIGAYSLLFLYYVVNIWYAKTGRLNTENPVFFLGVLSVKIVVWGLLLIGLRWY